VKALNHVPFLTDSFSVAGAVVGAAGDLRDEDC
jgi:hypothetical protein